MSCMAGNRELDGKTEEEAGRVRRGDMGNGEGDWFQGRQAVLSVARSLDWVMSLKIAA